MTSEFDIAPLSSWPVKLHPLFLLAGPCSAETREQVMETARRLAQYPVSAIRTGIWKPRTRPGTFEGIGDDALSWLRDAGRTANLPVAVEAANARHVEACLKGGIKIIWIGARTTNNPFAVQEIADALKGTDMPLMVKNPVSPDLELWIGAIERLHRAGLRRLAAIHRGFSTSRSAPYRNDPLWRIPIELRRRIPDLPLICDPSHICGQRDLLFAIAQEALDLLYDGLMIEVHHDPDRALSDSKQQVTPEIYGEMIRHLKLKQTSAGNISYHEQMAILRGEIDRVDGRLIEVLAERMEIVRKMSLCKRQNNVSSFQPGRWEEIVQTRQRTAAEHGLNPDFIFGIFERIHEEALQQQESVMQETEGQSEDRGHPAR